MTNKNNKNAFVGISIEHLIKKSLLNQPLIIEKLKNKFNIKGSLESSASSGIYGEKSDIRINFTCGHYIDANIKGFKNSIGFNQLARTTVSKFCEHFGINEKDKSELETIIITKSKNRNNPLFSEEDRKKWEGFFVKNAKSLLKWGFSKNASREILILYNRDTSIVKIYAMKDVLNCLPVNIVFTKGGFNIGDCISFQRKGGNGSFSKLIPKTTIQHPGNNIQLKVKINKLIEILEPVMLAEYKI